MKKAWAPKQTGFTIVELLIVIVIIAILATISIVAYSGVRDRSARAQTTSAVSAYAKALSVYASDKGAYPGYTNACLGGSENTNNRCYRVSDTASTCTGAGAAYGITAFDNEIRPYMGGKLAVPSQDAYSCGGQPYAGALYYSSAPTVSAFIFAILKASAGPCPDIGSTTKTTYNSQDEIIICRYQLPSL